jgi:hypothetical protein
MSKSQLRKTAYEYIKDQINRIHDPYDESGHLPIVPLNELMLLKEGIADPSVELVASLKRLLKGLVPEAEIDVHLVTPFQQPKTD